MLKYVGDGSWLPGVPARDLTDEEVKEFGEEQLLATGLYGKVNQAPAPKTKAQESPKEGA